MATEIARWIASHREERKQNQTEFARSVGVSLRSVQNWEAGATVPAGRQRRLLVSYIGEDLPGTPLSTAAELAALRGEVRRVGELLEAAAEARKRQVDLLVRGQAQVVEAVEKALEAIPSTRANEHTRIEPGQP